MEFLKTCQTNAQAIGDYEAVAFQALSVARDPDHVPPPHDGHLNNEIRDAEAELRRDHHLVLSDPSRPWLWLFRATAADPANQRPLELPSLDGTRFQRQQHGIMKASELARPPMRPATTTSSPLAQTASKAASGTAARLTPNSSQPGTASDQQQLDSSIIYELFTSAVVALISYHLVRDYAAIALNYRTFVSKPNAEHRHAANQSSPATPYWLTNLNVLWASSGTLLVSTYSLVQDNMHRLDEVVGDDEQKTLVGKCVRIGPGGTLAQVVSFDDPLDSATEDMNQRGQRKKAKIAPLEQALERWKSTVARWLDRKGYVLRGLESKTSWVRIRTSYQNQSALPSPTFLHTCREFLWPRALCFFYNDPSGPSLGSASDPARGHAEKALEWFETTTSTGFKDPVDSVQQWFLGKVERDKMMEARRRAKKAEEDAARIKEETQGIFPSSPLNVRPGTYGDLQAVSGVYPTPPDGVPPGTAFSSGDTPSVSGTITNVILAPGGTNPAINISAPHETTHVDGQFPQHPATSPELPIANGQYNADGNNDDLFEDMEGFEGTGITEDDFDFFDGPDGEDDEMPDEPSLEGTKPVPSKTEETVLPAAPTSAVKEEEPDPMRGLETALSTALAAVSDKNGTAESPKSAAVHTDAQPHQRAAKGSPLSGEQNSFAPPPFKEPTPPLSPVLIEKVLLPSTKAPRALGNSAFDPLNFNRKMSLTDAKYQGGRFSFPDVEPSKSVEDKTVSHGPKSLRDLPMLTKLRYAIGVASTKGTHDAASIAEDESDTSDSGSDSSSDIDEDLDEVPSLVTVTLPAGLIIPAKRKLPTDGNATPLSATSFAESFGGDFPDAVGLETDASTLAHLEPGFSDWALIDSPVPIEIPSANSRYSIPAFSPVVSHVPDTPTSQPDILTDSLEDRFSNGKDSIAIAQIVTDQVVSATSDLLHEGPLFGDRTVFGRTPSENLWHNAIRSVFPKAMSCTVAALTALADVFPDTVTQAKGQQRPPPPRKPNEPPIQLGNHTNQINPPYIRVRRADVQWELLPPALPFWEPLGLAPCSPAKNIVAFCVYPHSPSLRPCVESLMLNIQLAYENCRLGNHARVETVQEYGGGLVPYTIATPVSTAAAVKALRDACVQLGKLLALKHAQMRDKEGTRIDAFVIYMIDPFESPSAIWELCSAFWAIFQAYGQGPQGRPDQPQKPDLVLQIIPIKYVASFEVPVILDASVYASFAREVYDRCPPSAPCEDKTPLSIYTAPSFQLEEPLPRSVPFKLIAEPPQDILHENSYMHIGYAISLDGAWVTAAWTDICGKSQAIVSYHLGTRMLGEIAKEIWQTTLEIIQARRVTWRVCIAKSGVMEKEEMEAWIYLVSCPAQVNLFITLLAVDTKPHLRFTPTFPSTNPTNAPTTSHTSTNTPGSTPQAGISPEHGLTPAATPSADAAPDPATDPDARLVDTTDETWGIILAHRLHNSNSINEFRPALISGLLVKRGLSSASLSCPHAPDPERGPVIVAVNILWMGAVNPTRAATSPFPPSAVGSEGISPGGIGVSPIPSPQERSLSSLTWTPTLQTRAAAENLLKEVLGQFRGLGLLARLRGMRGTRHGTVPWHVAAAARGVKGLGMCLPP